jgi:hypothetical protein
MAGKVRKCQPVNSAEVAHYLADLPSLYVGAEPVTRHRIVQALFERVGVLGPSEVWLFPSLEAEARGWAAAMSGEFRMELRKSGRGERDSPSLTQRPAGFVLINRTARDRAAAELTA